MLALIKRVNVQLTSNYTGLRCYALEADPSQLNESGTVPLIVGSVKTVDCKGFFFRLNQ